MEPCRPIQMFPGVWHIETPGNVYVTLLAGEKRALLVDTGLGLCDLAGIVYGLTSLPLTVVNTHGHNDHLAGNYQFPQALLSTADRQVAETAMLPEIRRRVLACREPDTVPPGYLEYHLDNLSPLAGTEVFDLGGLHARVLPLPTHTPGSVGLLVPEYDLLLGADSVSPFTSLFFPEAAPLRAHIALLDALLKDPPACVLSSHCERLIPSNELLIYLACARHYDPSRTLRYRDQYFPRFRGRLFCYGDPAAPGQSAFLVCPDPSGKGETAL